MGRGRPKKYHTEAERKEAHKLSIKKWSDNNKDKIKESRDKWRVSNKDYQSKWIANNKEAKKLQEIRYNNSRFYVYTHSNSKGDLYIGSGNRRRPKQLSNDTRSKYWIEAFDNDCKVKIIREFETKVEAKELESLIIDTIGIENLINSRRA